jgi:hypothetical protein
MSSNPRRVLCGAMPGVSDLRDQHRQIAIGTPDLPQAQDGPGCDGAVVVPERLLVARCLQ